jgi:hypothetical protein
MSRFVLPMGPQRGHMEIAKKLLFMDLVKVLPLGLSSGYYSIG